MDIRQTVTQLYHDYASRNLDKVLNGLPDDFCFEWASNPRTARYSGICHTKHELVTRLREIAENFEFHSYRPTIILVDGDHAAAQLVLDLTSTKTRQRFPERIAHFWSFKDGVPVHLVEYMDTALIASQSA
jgi:ketosteroid isomerase-like protein